MMEKHRVEKKIEEYPVGSILGEEEIEAIRNVFASGQPLTRGLEIDLFEKEFAEYCDTKYAIALSSCSAALHISTQLLNLHKNDEVICQGNSFWTAYAPLLDRGVKIKVADVEQDTLNINPEKIESIISKNTKAIYLLHHGGNPADINAVKEIAEKNSIHVVEDCAHAAGSEYKGRKIGKDSEIACFSFSTLKNITTLGEGGMIVTNNHDFYEMAKGLRTNFPYGERVMRNIPSIGDYPKPKSIAFMHAGDAWDYDWIKAEEFGKTYRMSTPQAAVGRVQLRKLDKFIQMRTKIADRYNEALEEMPVFRKLKILKNCKHSWQLFSFFLNKNKGIDRNQLARHLSEKYNISIVIRFWPIHLGGIMRMNGHVPGECPVLEHVWFNEQLSLPISPQMNDSEINYIIDSLKSSVLDI